MRDKSGKKIKIESQNIASYSFENNLYEHNDKFKAFTFVKNDAYLKLTFNSRVIKVYEYKRNDPLNNYTKTFYILEKNGELTNLNWQNYKSDLSKLLADNPALVSLIMDDVYNLQNIYLIAKYYSVNR
ncbi:MAG: hypothetical protein V4548_07445 [Bacteroidota bacterium]